jgi:hypothetical protein
MAGTCSEILQRMIGSFEGWARPNNVIGKMKC